MDWSTRFAWLAAWRGLPAMDAADTDRADMGTAFGLDASFDRFAAPASPPDVAEPPGAAPAWEKRLIRRSGL
ncbi:MAG: hypothetical protein ABI702_02560 [Burkholderiales bacterium]